MLERVAGPPGAALVAIIHARRRTRANHFVVPRVCGMTERSRELREHILGLIGEYHAETFAARPFVPGESAVPVSGKVFDAEEMRLLVDSALDFWLTTGRYAERFEREFARWMEVRECVLVNSGSSANLAAVSALTSPELAERRLVPGDEVITVAAGFPTTVNPLFQNGL